MQDADVKDRKRRRSGGRAGHSTRRGSAAIEQMIREHEQNEFDHSYRLWALLVLELWMREWLTPQPQHDRDLTPA